MLEDVVDVAGDHLQLLFVVQKIKAHFIYLHAQFALVMVLNAREDREHFRSLIDEPFALWDLPLCYALFCLLCTTFVSVCAKMRFSLYRYLRCSLQRIIVVYKLTL